MKAVRTFVNEEEFKQFKKIANRMKISEYALNKKIVVEFLDSQKFWQSEQEIALNIAYWFLCYTLIVATILLVVF